MLSTDPKHQLSVWVGSQNLFVITNYRGFYPNVSSGGATSLAVGYDTSCYPMLRTWLAGVEASFQSAAGQLAVVPLNHYLATLLLCFFLAR